MKKRKTLMQEAGEPINGAPGLVQEAVRSLNDPWMEAEIAKLRAADPSLTKGDAEYAILKALEKQTKEGG